MGTETTGERTLYNSAAECLECRHVSWRGTAEIEGRARPTPWLDPASGPEPAMVCTLGRDFRPHPKNP